MITPARLTALLLALSPALSRAQDAPRLGFPVDCVLGETCYIQQYMDRDQGPGALDFTCGPLSYDGHSGTDIALPTLRAMQAGVNVLAAAPGRVRGVRDGMADQLYTDETREAVAGRDCGNGVAIDHGNGWETQYCHLALGSVTVRPGDSVQTGDVLGRIGLSGRTQFPHLHLSLRHNGQEIDPFGPGDDTACALSPAGDAALWSVPVPYVPGGLLALAFADHMPDFTAVKAGTAETAITRTSDVIVIHALVWGVRAGDILSMQMTGPGDIVVSQEIGLDRTQAQVFRAIGKRRPEGGWPAGQYQGRVLLMRGNDVLGSAEIAAEVR